MKSVRPSFLRTNYGSQRIIHREKVAKLSTPGTGVFKVLGSYPLNPGMTETFPWLSNEAQGWESYRFNRLRFIWVPTSGTATVGNIIMGPDYDAADDPPAGETFFSSYTSTEEANVWARFASELDSSLLNGEQKRKFIRSGALADNLDIKTYDSGNFFVASADDAAANSGKLWVEYDVELYNPQVPPGGFQASGVLSGQASVALSAASPFGDEFKATGPLILTPAANVVTIQNIQVGQVFSVSVGVFGGTISDITLTPSGATVRFSYGGANAVATSSALLATYVATSSTITMTVGFTAAAVSSTNMIVSVLAPIPTLA